MHIKLTVSVLSILLMIGCGKSERSEIETIHEVMEGQSRAWNNGDLKGFMNGYWMSDSLVFTGGKTVSYGWQQALDRYEVSYPTEAEMGHLTFLDLHTDILSESSAFSFGAWRLDRKMDTLQGRFTLVWKKVRNSWVIIGDHSS